MGHLVNPVGIRLNHSLTWTDSWNASNKSHYFSYYSNIILLKTYLNYFFARAYIENFGIFFSHFSVSWKYNKFIVEINLYDGRIEDWIETCMGSFSVDIKRLIVYTLRAFRQTTKNAEFARSSNLDLFRFSTLLVLRLFFKMDETLFQSLYSDFPQNSNVVKLLYNLLSFLLERCEREDLVLKRANLIARFLLRMYTLMFYQIPLYNYMINPLRINLFSILNTQPHLILLGIENKNITSIFIARFLTRKLAQKYRWTELMSALKKELNYLTDTEKLLYGYKIQFRGRFTRRSRSEAVSSTYGRVSTSTIDAWIDYSISNLTLRNGSGSVKVWLYKAPRFRLFSYKIL